MDLVLIRPNDQKAIYGELTKVTACEPPFWAVSIAAFIQMKGFEVSIIDAEVDDLSPEEVAKQVQQMRPQLVLILVTGTNLSASTWKMEGAGLLASLIKETYSGNVAMWGLHPSALPEQTLREETIDFVIKGEGFQSICSLLERIDNDSANFNINGVFYKNKMGEIIGNSTICLEQNLSILPKPAWELVPMQKYKAHNWHCFGDRESMGNYAVIATSLGCPFNCEFCAVSALFDQRRVRYKSPEKVVEEIDDLVERYKIHYIKILDECFILNKEHVSKICDLLIERKYDLNIWAYARIDTVDEFLLNKLSKAGVRWLAYGIESANEKALADVAKGQYGVSKIKEVIQMTQKYGIFVNANYIFGLPEDDFDSMWKTLELALGLNTEWANFYTAMAYPGSKLYAENIHNIDLLPKNWRGYSQYSYECMPLASHYLSSGEILSFRDYAFDVYFKNPVYLEKMKRMFGKSAVQNIKKMTKHSLEREQCKL